MKDDFLSTETLRMNRVPLTCADPQNVPLRGQLFELATSIYCVKRKASFGHSG